MLLTAERKKNEQNLFKKNEQESLDDDYKNEKEIKGSGPVRMTDSVQNLLLALRLKSENTEDAPEPPILRARVPGVDSAASGDGACCDKSARGRENQTPSGTRGMIRSS